MARTIRTYVMLTKPKIQAMLVFTAYAAMLVGNHGIPGWKVTIATLVGLGLTGGGSAAINMWYDRDIDAIMRRTQDRPLPMGEVRPTAALVYGVILCIASVALLALAVNPLSAVLSGAGAVYYAWFYTMWLKRRTPQNIVIGGGAGAFPPLVGWAAVTNHVGVAAIIMFLVIFFWTPPHFWPLALYKNEDYTRAGIPMMPVVRGPKVTKLQSVGYAVVLTATTVSLYFTGTVGVVYAWTSLALSLVFLGFTVRLYFERNASHTWAKRTFAASLAYLPIVFTVMVLNSK